MDDQAGRAAESAGMRKAAGFYLGRAARAGTIVRSMGPLRHADRGNVIAAHAEARGLSNPRGGSIDEEAARELELFVENDRNLYERQFIPIVKNLMLKRQKGVFDPEKAVKLFMYLMDAGARKYTDEFGNKGDRIDVIFSKPTRMEVARRFRDSFVTEANLGNYDHLLVRASKAKTDPRRGMSEFGDDLAKWEAGFRFKLIPKKGGPSLYAMDTYEAARLMKVGDYQVRDLAPPRHPRENPLGGARTWRVKVRYTHPETRKLTSDDFFMTARTRAEAKELAWDTLKHDGLDGPGAEVISADTFREATQCSLCGGSGRRATASSARGSALERHERRPEPCPKCRGSGKALSNPQGPRSRFAHQRTVPPGRFDRRSFRTVRSGRHRVVVGCPKGKWDAGRRRCRVGMRAQSILHPKGNPSGLRPSGVKVWCDLCGEWAKSKGPYRIARAGPSRGKRLCAGCWRGMKSWSRTGYKGLPRRRSTRIARKRKNPSVSLGHSAASLGAAVRGKLPRNGIETIKTPRLLIKVRMKNGVPMALKWGGGAWGALPEWDQKFRAAYGTRKNPPETAPFQDGEKIPLGKYREWLKANGTPAQLTDFDKAVALQTKANRAPDTVLFRKLEISGAGVGGRMALVQYGETDQHTYKPPKGSKKSAEWYRHEWEGAKVPLLVDSSGKNIITPLGKGQTAGDWLRG